MYWAYSASTFGRSLAFGLNTEINPKFHIQNQNHKNVQNNTNISHVNSPTGSKYLKGTYNDERALMAGHDDLF